MLLMSNGVLARDDGLLTAAEANCVVLQPFLEKHGYKLRRRYHPKWRPSWTKPWNFYKDMRDCSDWIRIPPVKVNLIDAVRIHDGMRVVIKRVVLGYDNVPLLVHLNTPEMRQDIRNNTVPLLDVLILPDESGSSSESSTSALLVMPMLFPFMSPHLPFRHVREVVEALDQIIQGIQFQFLHEHNIAHRDSCLLNFMMDPTNVIPSSFHYTVNYYQPDGKRDIKYEDRCSVAPVRYYTIDFETADYFPPGANCLGLYGQVKDVPEMSITVPYDPFKLDVYQLGDVLNKVIQEYDGLDFLEHLSKNALHPDPSMRPTSADLYHQFADVVSLLSPEDLTHEIWTRDSTTEERRTQSIPPKVETKFMESYLLQWWRKLMALF